MTRELLFHLGVRMLGIYTLISGLARLIASLVGQVQPLDAIIMHSDTTWCGHFQAQGAMEIVLGAFLLWQVKSIVRWCGIPEPLTGDSDIIAQWSEAALKLAGILVWVWTALLLPEAYQRWQSLRGMRLDADGGSVLSESIGKEPTIVMFAVTGLLLFAGARYLAENVIRRQVQA